MLASFTRVLRSERALRVIPRGKHGWRFTARIKYGYNEYISGLRVT